MLKTLMELCKIDGVSGDEQKVCDYIRTRITPFADSVRQDVNGNLLVFKKGKRDIGKKVMLCAHMDEIGIIVKSVTDEGYVKFGFVGGVDRRVAIGKRVRIGEKGVPGVIGIKAYHLVSEAEEKQVPKVTDLYIDIGVQDKQEALGLVSLGDTGVFDTQPALFGQGLIKARAIDDRAGCAALIKLIEQPAAIDAWYCFSVMEEVGTRGALGAAFGIDPDIAVVVEGTTAADIAGVDAHKRVCEPGKGAVIPFMDRGTVYHKEIQDGLIAAAESLGLNWQTKRFVSGGTDADAIQRTRGGVRTGGIAAAVRYIHCPCGVAHLGDLNALPEIVGRYLTMLGEK